VEEGRHLRYTRRVSFLASAARLTPRHPHPPIRHLPPQSQAHPHPLLLPDSPPLPKLPSFLHPPAPFRCTYFFLFCIPRTSQTLLLPDISILCFSFPPSLTLFLLYHLNDCVDVACSWYLILLFSFKPLLSWRWRCMAFLSELTSFLLENHGLIIYSIVSFYQPPPFFNIMMILLHFF